MLTASYSTDKEHTFAGGNHIEAFFLELYYSKNGQNLSMQVLSSLQSIKRLCFRSSKLKRHMQMQARRHSKCNMKRTLFTSESYK